MRVSRGWPRRPLARPTVLAIGVFDGVHRGHRVLLRRVVALARRLRARPAVLTFPRHPLALLDAERAPRFLMNVEDRLTALAQLGIRDAFVIPFTRYLARVPAERFVRKALVGRLRLSALVVGPNFRFGRHRRGTLAQLKAWSRRYGYRCEVVSAQRWSGRMVSSTAIRRALARGRLRWARLMLGRPYLLDGRVVRGARRGSRLGFPTANVRTSPGRLVPGRGVYAVRVRLDGRGRWWKGMANIGRRPTVHRAASLGASAGAEPLVLEVHILDFPYRSLYGRRIEVCFARPLRRERRFASLQGLQAQLRRDARTARRVLARPGILFDTGGKGVIQHSGPQRNSRAQTSK